MRSVFMDTNVVIDFLANRAPFAMDAARLFDMAVNGEITVFISAVSYNNIYYVLRQSLSSNATIKLLEELADITEVADVNGSVINQALKSGFKDFEDAIQYYCALGVPRVEIIITRNTKDFKRSTLSVLTPSEALAALTGNI